MDPIVYSFIQKIKSRSQKGIEKYKTTLQENNTDNFLLHLQEELADASLYIEKLLNSPSKASLDFLELPEAIYFTEAPDLPLTLSITRIGEQTNISYTSEESNKFVAVRASSLEDAISRMLYDLDELIISKQIKTL